MVCGVSGVWWCGGVVVWCAWCGLCGVHVVCGVCVCAVVWCVVRGGRKTPADSREVDHVDVCPSAILLHQGHGGRRDGVVANAHSHARLGR